MKLTIITLLVLLKQEKSIKNMKNNDKSYKTILNEIVFAHRSIAVKIIDSAYLKYIHALLFKKIH